MIRDLLDLCGRVGKCLEWSLEIGMMGFLSFQYLANLSAVIRDDVAETYRAGL
jgi:hypothetical protein